MILEYQKKLLPFFCDLVKIVVQIENKRRQLINCNKYAELVKSVKSGEI
jgi:hypothetical protein